MKRQTFLLFLTCLTALFVFGQSASASPASELKERMKERLPKIESLWKADKIGEGNKGFLVARVKLATDEEKLIAAENADRRIVYTAIARSTGETPEKVGVQRAIQIAARAGKGLWLQSPNGDWYKK